MHCKIAQVIVAQWAETRKKVYCYSFKIPFYEFLLIVGFLYETSINFKTSNILSLFWTYLVHCVSRNEKEGRGLDHKMSSANIEMELQQREGINCMFHLFLLFFFREIS